MSDRPASRPVPPLARASARERAYADNGTNDRTSTEHRTMPRTGTLANRMLSARDVAAILAIPEGTVRDKWWEWGLPAYKIGKHLRWRERDLYARGLTARPRDMRAGPARHERVSACFRALPYFPVSHLYRCARRRTGVKIAVVPPVTSFASWCG
jgi:hypothetical protein